MCRAGLGLLLGRRPEMALLHWAGQGAGADAGTLVGRLLWPEGKLETGATGSEAGVWSGSPALFTPVHACPRHPPEFPAPGMGGLLVALPPAPNPCLIPCLRPVVPKRAKGSRTLSQPQRLTRRELKGGTVHQVSAGQQHGGGGHRQPHPGPKGGLLSWHLKHSEPLPALSGGPPAEF